MTKTPFLLFIILFSTLPVLADTWNAPYEAAVLLLGGRYPFPGQTAQVEIHIGFNAGGYAATIGCGIEQDGRIISGCAYGGYTARSGLFTSTIPVANPDAIKADLPPILCPVKGSVIDYQSKTVAEQIPIDGTGMYLNFTSAYNENIDLNKRILIKNPNSKDPSFPTFAAVQLQSDGIGGPAQKVCMSSYPETGCISRSASDKNLIDTTWDGTAANQSTNIFTSKLNYKVEFLNYIGGPYGYSIPGNVNFDFCDYNSKFQNDLLPATENGSGVIVVKVSIDYAELPTNVSVSTPSCGSGGGGTAYLDYQSYAIAKSQRTLVLYHPSVWGLKGWTINSHNYLELPTGRMFKGDGTTATYENIKHYYSAEYNQEVYYVPNKGSTDEFFIFSDQGLHLETRSLLKTSKPLQKFYYDTDFRLLKIENINGKFTQFIYDGNNQITKIIAPYGQITNIIADQKNITSVTDSLNHSYEMNYSDQGLLNSFKSVTGVITTFAYDNSGGLIQESKNNGLLQTFTSLSDFSTETFNVLMNWGRKIYVVLSFSEGRQLAVTKNNIGETISQSLTSDSATLFYSSIMETTTNASPHPFWGSNLLVTNGYGEKSLVNSSPLVNENENITNYASVSLINGYPMATKLGTAVNYSGITLASLEYNYFLFEGINYQHYSKPANDDEFSIVTYDEKLLPTQLNQPRRSPVNLTYNSEGQLIQTSRANEFETYTYDQYGNLASSTNSKNQTTLFARDSQGKLLAKTLPNGDQIKYEYTNGGELKKIVTPSNQQHNFQMDLGDYLSQYLNSDNKVTEYHYDTDKRLTSIVKPGQKTITFNRNSLTGALDSVSTPNGEYLYSNQDVEYKPRTITSPDGIKMDISYVGNNIQQTKWYDTDGSEISTLKINYRSNRMQISNILLNGDRYAYYGFDTYGRIQTVNEAYYALEPDKTSVFLGQIQTQYQTYENSDGSRQFLNSAYINVGQGQLFITLSRTFDGYGQAVDFSQKTQNLASGVYNSFTTQAPQYDQNNRLIQTQRNRKSYLNSQLTDSTDFQNQYFYPPGSNNNMTEFTQIINNFPSRRTTASFATDDKLLSLNGSINRQYTYSEDGNIKTMTNCYGTTSYEYDVFGNLKKVVLPDGKLVEYKVDGFNRRVKKLVNGVTIEYYIWQDQLKLAAILDANKVPVVKYVYGSESESPSLVIKNDVTYKIVQDPGLGSIRYVLRPDTQQIVQEIEYDEYGNIMNNTNPTFQPLLFTGGLYDFDTKLYRFGARDYDPTIGRWTTKDPIGFAGGDTNLYAYVGGNPMSYNDPEGKSALGIVAAIVCEGIAGYNTVQDFGTVADIAQDVIYQKDYIKRLREKRDRCPDNEQGNFEEKIATAEADLLKLLAQKTKANVGAGKGLSTAILCAGFLKL